MPQDVPPRVLKHNRKRTVLLAGEDGCDVVVKRFHAPGGLDRWRDPWRARREARRLRALRALGLPVPSPLAVRRAAPAASPAWDLVVEHLPGADLDRLLDGRAPWPTAPGRVAVQLGRLYARLLRARITLTDLHAGNVLIDPTGAPWLLDPAGLRRRSVEGLALELCTLAAGVRERTSPRFRARFFCALRAAAGDAAPPRAWLEALEQRARHVRRANVADRVARWWRDSGDTRALAPDCVARRDVSDEVARRVLAGDPTACGPDVRIETVRGPAARARWELAARLEMHLLPGPRPLCARGGPDPLAAFAWPATARPLEERWTAADPVERTLLLHAAGAALGAVDDRGLALVHDRGTGVWVARTGHALLVPGSLVPLMRTDATGVAACLFEELAPRPDAGARAAFAEGFVGAHRSTAEESRRLRRELGVG